jgi:hypothetical protein
MAKIIGMKIKLLLILVIFNWLPIFARSGWGQVDSIKPYQIEKIFPNPITDYFFIEIEASTPFTIFFELIDILGQPVQKWEPMEVSPGVQRIKLHMDDHHSGIYLLKAQIGEDDVVFRVRKV